MNSDSPHLRFAIVGIVTISLFAALFARLWFLQVMTSPEYEVAARNLAVRSVQEEAARGRVLDRQGTVLVDNRRSIQVTVDWQKFNGLEEPEQNRLLQRLSNTLTRFAPLGSAGSPALPPPADLKNWPAGTVTTTTSPSPTTTSTTTSLAPLSGGGAATATTAPLVEVDAGPKPVTVKQVRDRLNSDRFSHFKPVPIATDVSVDLEIFLVEHADEFPTVAVQQVTVRQYHYGTLLAHVLGYVGQANPADIDAFQNKAKPYDVTAEIGKAGIERTMESELRGTPGLTRIEVDARNKPVREVEVSKPIPGNDVYLSVDIGLQYVVERSLATQIGRPGKCTKEGCPQAKTGAAVVTDPTSGQVLAMASYPTYDPSVWIGGISNEDYDALNSKDNGEPLVNKAVAGTYAPGSTWKLFSAFAGLTNQQITPSDVVVDDGAYQVPGCDFGKCEFTNASRIRHGPVDLSRALTVSSDVYFYKLGDEMWRRREQIGPDALKKSYSEWGFGEKTGSGLPGELRGRLPSPAQKKELASALYKGNEDKINEFGRWTSGDNMNTTIGQGDVLVTPLQLVNGYGTFANGGTLYQPTLVAQVNESFSKNVILVVAPLPTRKIDLRPEWQLPMAAGFAGVTRDTYGTAVETFAGFPQDTFPVAGKTGTAQVNKKIDTSLFVAYAPANYPKFAVTVILPEAGNGGSAAAPAVRRILQPLAQVNGDMARLERPPQGGRFDPNAPDQFDAPPSSGID